MANTDANNSAALERLRQLQLGLDNIFDTIPPSFSVEKIKPSINFYCMKKCKGRRQESEPEGDQLSEAENIHYDFRFDPRLEPEECVFIVHGFMNTIETAWMHLLKNEILKTQKLRPFVFIVGWGGGANLSALEYTQAVANTQVVGEWLAGYLKKLREALPRAKIRCIGHSLGAHIMGCAARLAGTGVVNRIDALDPAGPSWDKEGRGFFARRLTKDDAPFVQVVHTDGYRPSLHLPNVGVSVPTPLSRRREGAQLPISDLITIYGTLLPMGHLDFYPNLGCRQPGALGVSDSHGRAYELYTDSIRCPGKFKTHWELKEEKIPLYDWPVPKLEKCDKVVEMGYHSEREPGNVDGKFFLMTRSRPPWLNEKSQVNTSTQRPTLDGVTLAMCDFLTMSLSVPQTVLLNLTWSIFSMPLSAIANPTRVTVFPNLLEPNVVTNIPAQLMRSIRYLTEFVSQKKQ